MENDPTETLPQQERSRREKSRRTALQQATAYLARGLVPEAKLNAYLSRKGYEKREIEAAVAALKEGGYLREGELATSRARALAEQRGYWGWALGARLRQDGFSDTNVEKGLAWVRENHAVEELAIATLERRYGENWQEVPPRRMAGFLERHGFPSSLIAALLRKARQKGPGGGQ